MKTSSPTILSRLNASCGFAAPLPRRLYYLIVGIIEGDVRWCDVLKVHRDTPLRAV